MLLVPLDGCPQQRKAKRTMKYFQAVLRGAWIVCEDWIRDSDGEWADEQRPVLVPVARFLFPQMLYSGFGVGILFLDLRIATFPIRRRRLSIWNSESSIEPARAWLLKSGTNASRGRAGSSCVCVVRRRLLQCRDRARPLLQL